LFTYRLRPLWALREDLEDLRHDLGVSKRLRCRLTVETTRGEIATVEALIAERVAGVRREGGGLR